MQKPQHTPEPWEIEKNTKALIIKSKATGCRIAQCSKDGSYTPAQKANAHLIKAAPKLLSALEAVASGMMQTQGFIPNFMETAIKEAKETGI